MTASAIPPAAIAAELDRKIAGTEPLLEVVRWYREICLASSANSTRPGEGLILNVRSCTANEIAAQNLGLEDYTTEAEVATDPVEYLRYRVQRSW